MSNPLLEEQGLPKFIAICPEHIEPALQETLQRNRTELEALLQSTEAPTFGSAIAPLENMMDRLHRAWAPVNHLHMVANTDELRDVYNRCLPILSDYTTELSQDERLFDLHRKVNQAHEGEDTPEAKLLENSLRDFHLSGVDLPADKKELYKKAVSELTQLQATFEQNLLDEMAHWSTHETNAENIAGIPSPVLAQARRQAEAAGLEGWLLQLDQPTYVAVLTHADNRALRETFYRAWVTRCSDQSASNGKFDNTQLMDNILKLRYDLSLLVGYVNFADYALATRMAESVDAVEKFLLELAEVSLPVAKKEFATLEQWADTKLASWDVPSTARSYGKNNSRYPMQNCAPISLWNACWTGCSACCRNSTAYALRNARMLISGRTRCATTSSAQLMATNWAVSILTFMRAQINVQVHGWMSVCYVVGSVVKYWRQLRIWFATTPHPVMASQPC